MKIGEIMTKKVISISRDANVCEVAKIMHKNKIHGVPVLEGRNLVGIITETDFFIKNEIEFHLPSYIDFLTSSKINEGSNVEDIIKTTAGDIMTKTCITLEPESDVKDLLSIAKEKNIHTFPVVSEGVLKGVVTIADVIKLL